MKPVVIAALDDATDNEATPAAAALVRVSVSVPLISAPPRWTGRQAAVLVPCVVWSPPTDPGGPLRALVAPVGFWLNESASIVYPANTTPVVSAVTYRAPSRPGRRPRMIRAKLPAPIM